MSSLESLFCHIDDFCKCFEHQWKKRQVPEGKTTRQRTKSLCLSEIMTILVSFHQNHYRNFKHYYIDHVAVYWLDAFPQLPSYQRFIAWIPSTLIPLCVYLKHCSGQCTGTGFIVFLEKKFLMDWLLGERLQLIGFLALNFIQ